MGALSESLTWSRLRSLGEVRLLRISYIIIVLVPSLAGVYSHLNRSYAAARSTVEEIFSTLSSRSALLAQSIRNASPELAPHAELLTEWAEHEGLPEFETTLELRFRLEEVDFRDAVSNRRVISFAKELAHLSDLLRKQTGLKHDPPFRILWPTKMLFLAMVFISVANAIYAGSCPREIQPALRGSRYRGRSGLGPEIDWQQDTLRVLEGGGTTATLAQATLERHSPGRNFADLHHLIEGMWHELDTYAPIRRVVCCLCYWFGLIMCGAWILVQSFRVLGP